jgi:hypothetical protein
MAISECTLWWGKKPAGKQVSGWWVGVPVVRLQPSRGVGCIYEVTLASRFLCIFSPFHSMLYASVLKAHLGVVEWLTQLGKVRYSIRPKSMAVGNQAL